MSNVTEGIDYIIDRYAILEVPRDADPAVIRAAVRTGRAANHPDRLRGASQEILTVAAARRHHIDNAAAILLDPVLRAGYDERLAVFERDRPQAVSTNGNAIVDMSRPIWDIDDLLGEETDDDRERLDQVRARANALSGHNAGQQALLERLFAANPDDPDLRAALREARVANWIRCSFLEDVAWGRVGLNKGTQGDPTPATANPFEGLDRVQQEVEEMAVRAVPAALALRHEASLLRLAPPLRLLGHDTAAAPTDPDIDPNALPARPLSDSQILAEITARAQEAFRVRSEAVLTAAKDRQDALNAALELTPVRVLGAPTGALYLLIALGNPDRPETTTPVAPMSLSADGAITESSLAARATVGDWTAHPPADGTLLVVGHHNEITPLLAEIWWTAARAERWRPDRAESSDGPVAPATSKPAPKPPRP